MKLYENDVKSYEIYYFANLANALLSASFLFAFSSSSSLAFFDTSEVLTFETSEVCLFKNELKFEIDVKELATV